MKQIIGSRMAAKLAVQKFGDNAGILRHRRCFMIVKVWHLSRRLSVTSLKGIGRSWEKALEDAGIDVSNLMPNFITKKTWATINSNRVKENHSIISAHAGINPDMIIIDDLEEKQ